MSDTTPPNLTGLTFPSTIDLSTNDQITFTLAATDDLSVVWADIIFDKPINWLRDNQPQHGWPIEFESFSDGQSSVTLTLLYNTPGLYSIRSLELFDKAGNEHSFSAADLANLGIATSLTPTDSASASEIAWNDRGYPNPYGENTFPLFIGFEFATASKWSTGLVPGPADDIIINGLVTSSLDQTVNSLRMMPGSSLSILGSTFIISDRTGISVNYGEIQVGRALWDTRMTNGVLIVGGEVNNLGVIDLSYPFETFRTPGILNIDGSVTLSGGGQVQLFSIGPLFGPFGQSKILSKGTSATLINVDNTIWGAGEIGDASLTLINQINGVISGGSIINTGNNVVVNVGTITGSIQIQSAIENSGTLSGSVQIQAPITNSGLIVAWYNNAPLDLFGRLANTGIINSVGHGILNIHNRTVSSGTIKATTGGQLNILGSVISSGTILADAVGSILNIPYSVANSGTIASTNGATLNLSGALTNLGSVEANGGTVDIAATIAGAGVLKVGDGGMMILGTASAEDVIFSGSGNTLVLAQPWGFTGHFSGLAVGDTIDLALTPVARATINHLTLTIVETSGITLSYSLASPFHGLRFALQSDGAGGTNLNVIANIAPSVTASARITASTHRIAAVIDARVSLADADDSTLASATVSITSGFHSGEDVLAFRNSGYGMSNISGVYDEKTGALSLSSAGATATLAEWQEALRSITYTDIADTPSTADRTMSFIINDGVDDSAAGNKVISVAPAVHPAAVSLTTGADTFAGTAADDTVIGTAATLNASDRLDGDAGYNLLELLGPGTFDLNASAQLTNFQEVDLTNITGGESNLILRDGQSPIVNVDAKGGVIRLADGAMMLNLGASGGYTVYASSGTATINSTGANETFYLSTGAAMINATGGTNRFYLSTGDADIIDMGGGIEQFYVSTGRTSINVAGNTSIGTIAVDLTDVASINYDDVFTGSSSDRNSYIFQDGLSAHGAGEELDLTRLTLNNFWNLYIDNGVTVKVDAKSLSHLRFVRGGTLETADAALDLTETSVAGRITSTNPNGTTFTVADANTGLYAVGGPGEDTLVGQGFAFTASQRAAIFAQGSIETITDTSGTYLNLLLPAFLTTDNPDGTHTQEAWDVQNQNTWFHYVITYDNELRIENQRTKYHDGTLTVQTWDVQTQNTWSDWVGYYDGQNTETTHFVDKHDGTHTAQYFDVLNQNTWSDWAGYYDNQNRETVHFVDNHDGTRTAQYFDVLNQNTWSDWAGYYDSQNRQTTHFVNNHDGTRTAQYFDVLNQNPWTDYVYAYDNQGTLMSQTIDYRDGHHTVQMYDVAGTQKWSSVLTSYDANWQQQSQTFMYRAPPVVLDLDGNGVDITPLPASSASFDMNGSGERSPTAWVGGHDGLLAIDLGADGQAGADGVIDQAKEINFTLWAPGTTSDLQALRQVFDTDHDGKLDPADARWNEFRVWTDANANGVSEPGELQTLADLGITSIDLNPSPSSTTFPDGSVIQGLSSFTRTDGSTGLVGDVGFAYAVSSQSMPPDDGTHVGNLALLGNYMASAFVTASNGHAGSPIADPLPAFSQNTLLAPHS